MKNLLVLTALLGVACFASGAQAQDKKDDPIEAERPGFTNGTGTVPVGHLQFETGYLYSRSDAGVHEHRLGDSALLRIPTGTNTEFRIGLPVYSFTHLQEAASGSGGQSPTICAGVVAPACGWPAGSTATNGSENSGRPASPSTGSGSRTIPASSPPSTRPSITRDL